MKIYRKEKLVYLINQQKVYALSGMDWDELINREGLYHYLEALTKELVPLNITEEDIVTEGVLAPVTSQDVWAAGVTYYRSRTARMEESEDEAGANFYDKVYDADRPELFFKATGSRVVAPEEEVYIRKDSTWNVPEPELTLFINSKGNIQGYTIGNDMSSRSIEGENPLYLPQAKVYDRSAALGPCIFVPKEPLKPDTKISLKISRAGKEKFADEIEISQMKRSHTALVTYLYKENTFPKGCFLMTGTGIVPPDDFTLAVGDTIEIHIEGIGVLRNTVGVRVDH